MRKNEPWGAIAVPMEAHFTRKGQPPRMHGSALWKYKQKGQRWPLSHRAERTATYGAQGGMAKASQVGRIKVKQTPPDQGSDAEYDPLLEGYPVENISRVARSAQLL